MSRKMSNKKHPSTHTPGPHSLRNSTTHWVHIYAFSRDFCQKSHTSETGAKDLAQGTNSDITLPDMGYEPKNTITRPRALTHRAAHCTVWLSAWLPHGRPLSSYRISSYGVFPLPADTCPSLLLGFPGPALYHCRPNR